MSPLYLFVKAPVNLLDVAAQGAAGGAKPASSKSKSVEETYQKMVRHGGLLLVYAYVTGRQGVGTLHSFVLAPHKHTHTHIHGTLHLERAALCG